MKILLIGDNPKNNWKGSSTIYIQEQYAEALGSELPDAVALYYPHRRRRLLTFLFGPLVFSNANGYLQINGGIFPMLGYVVRGGFDVLHCVVTRSYMVWMVLIARAAGISIAVTLHDTLFLADRRLSLLRLARRFCFGVADVLFVLNQLDADRAEAHRGGRPGIRIVKNGIPLPNPLPRPEQTRTIVFGGGRGTPHKGLKFLEEGLAVSSVNIDLVICGPNAPGPAGNPASGEMNREDFHTLVRSARMVAVPSEYEPFSMIALESIALGTPVIITDACGIARYMTDGKDCLIVCFGDVEKLGSSIRALSEDDVLWNRLSQNGIETARAFAWNKLIPDYINVYSSLKHGLT
jgi:glycosyltransferase involved in cell wall biosynthesis